jgi:hypothetical protein
VSFPPLPSLLWRSILEFINVTELGSLIPFVEGDADYAMEISEFRRFMRIRHQRLKQSRVEAESYWQGGGPVEAPHQGRRSP